MKKKIQFTTVALGDNQYLIAKYHASIVETFCEGYTNDRRDKTIDGFYFTKELRIKTDLNTFNSEHYNEHIEANIKPL